MYLGHQAECVDEAVVAADEDPATHDSRAAINPAARRLHPVWPRRAVAPQFSPIARTQRVEAVGHAADENGPIGDGWVGEDKATWNTAIGVRPREDSQAVVFVSPVE